MSNDQTTPSPAPEAAAHDDKAFEAEAVNNITRKGEPHDVLNLDVGDSFTVAGVRYRVAAENEETGAKTLARANDPAQRAVRTVKGSQTLWVREFEEAGETEDGPLNTPRDAKGAEGKTEDDEYFDAIGEVLGISTPTAPASGLPASRQAGAQPAAMPRPPVTTTSVGMATPAKPPAVSSPSLKLILITAAIALLIGLYFGSDFGRNAEQKATLRRDREREAKAADQQQKAEASQKSLFDANAALFQQMATDTNGFLALIRDAQEKVGRRSDVICDQIERAANAGDTNALLRVDAFNHVQLQAILGNTNAVELLRRYGIIHAFDIDKALQGLRR